MYPVPVLNRDLKKDGEFVNVDAKRNDELDNQYVRRFFLFDTVESLSRKKNLLKISSSVAEQILAEHQFPRSYDMPVP